MILPTPVLLTAAYVIPGRRNCSAAAGLNDKTYPERKKKMKAKKIVTLTLAAALALCSTVSVTAADVRLTQNNPSDKVKVKARVELEIPGDISYVLTIPDELDFGVLKKPTNPNTDSFADVDYTVTATTITGLDPATQEIVVYVRDEGAVMGKDERFLIANEQAPDITFAYDVYDVTDIQATTAPISAGTMALPIGYLLTSFTKQGEKFRGKLRLDLHQLDQYNDVTAILGDYSGHMVFYSTINNK